MDINLKVWHLTRIPLAWSDMKHLFRLTKMWMCVLAVLSLASSAQAQNSTKGSKSSSSSKQVKRGEYLTKIGGCNDCHTPWTFNKELNMPVPDMSRMLSGHPEGAPDPSGTVGAQDIGLIGPTFTSFKMPFGVVYSANLTPDKDTGLGSWREAEFIKALRTGKHFGGNGRCILPPMPWMDFAHMTDEDLKAIFAYLRSIPPIRNAVPDPKVPTPALDGITESFEKLKQMMAASSRQK